MKIGIGGLGWRPADFWNATMTEFFQAIHGRNEANGAKEEQGAPSDKEMDALLQKYG